MEPSEFTFSGSLANYKRTPGGVPEEVRKKNKISKLWERHHEISRRILLGESNKDIAKAVGCSASWVSTVRNSPLIKEKLAVMSAARDAGTVDLAKEIMDLAPIALKRMREALTTGTVLNKELSAAGVMKEANSLLDRQIGRATQRVDSRSINAHFSLKDLEKIKLRAQELAKSSGMVNE